MSAGCTIEMKTSKTIAAIGYFGLPTTVETRQNYLCVIIRAMNILLFIMKIESYFL